LLIVRFAAGAVCVARGVDICSIRLINMESLSHCDHGLDPGWRCHERCRAALPGRYRLDAVATVLLGRVERPIGRADERGRITGVVGKDRHADAGGDLPEVGRVDRRNGLAQSLGDRERGLLVGGGEQHQELLASVAPDEVAVADRVTQRDAGGCKDLFAAVVAERVVDVLEVIEIEQQRPERAR
jgi:hypothetical protein